MDALISICIPTRNRPGMLRDAIESCFAQDYRPLELLLGDDSDDEAAAAVVRAARPPSGVTLTHLRNLPPLGQAANVNRLFANAMGTRLILLHDDDLLCPGSVSRLARAWDETPGARCVYGKQVVLNDGGVPLPGVTLAWNERDVRVPERAGLQRSSLAAALRQQMPNDGYIVETELARWIGVRHEDEIGHCVDTDFGIRLALLTGPSAFVYVDEFTSQYRLSVVSIARSGLVNRRHDLLYEAVEALPIGVETDREAAAEVEAAREALLRRLSDGATLDAALAGRPWITLRILFSRKYAKPLLSHWTAYRLLCAVSPSLGVRARQWARSLQPAKKSISSTCSGGAND